LTGGGGDRVDEKVDPGPAVAAGRLGAAQDVPGIPEGRPAPAEGTLGAAEGGAEPESRAAGASVAEVGGGASVGDASAAIVTVGAWPANIPLNNTRQFIIIIARSSLARTC